MYNECNCGNSQSLEIRGPSRRHHPEGTSETASPRFIPSILCSELHREPQFPVTVELLILEMGEMPLATSWAPPASREVIPVPDTPDGLKRSWSFLYIVGCVRARPDNSNGNPWKAWAKIPTQRAQTASEVLLVSSELRELFKTLACIPISTQRYRCIRFLFFFLPLFQEGASVISRTLRTRSSFDVYDMLGRTCLWCLLRFTVQIGLRKYLKPQYILECFHGFVIKIYHHGPNLTFLTITVLRNWTPYQHEGAISWT